MILNSDNIKRFKVVDLTDGRDMDNIISANDETGECVKKIQDKTETVTLIPGSFRIVRRN